MDFFLLFFPFYQIYKIIDSLKKYIKCWNKPVDYAKVYTPDGGKTTTKKYLTHKWVFQ